MAIYDPEILTPPAEPALALAEAKEHLRVEHADEDGLISSLCWSAHQWAEQYCRRSLVSRTLRQDYDLWPSLHQLPVELPAPPLASVTSIIYVDPDGAAQTLSSALYTVHAGTPGLVSLLEGQTWPVLAVQPRAVRVTYVAGYGTATDTPAPILAALKLLVGHWYRQREGVVIGTSASAVPMGVAALLGPYQYRVY